MTSSPTGQPTPARTVAGSTALLVHLVIGTVGLFVAFLFAYGFADEITPTLHAVFLVLVVLLAAVSGLLAAALARPAAGTWTRALTIGAWSALTCYAAALAVGTVVSLLNEAQNSVTADQPDAPFVVLVIGCAVAAVVGAGRWKRSLSRG